MAKIGIIRGHGGIDPGASGNGTNERDFLTPFVQKLSQYIPDCVVYDLTQDAYTNRNIVSWCQQNGISQVAEFHLDVGNDKGHVIVSSAYPADEFDNACERVVSKHFGSRGVVGRDDLYNMNMCAGAGISYRLIEVCPITNTEDMDYFRGHIDDVAKDFASALTGGAISQTQTGGNNMAQKSIFPMGYINVTQGPNGNFSHQGLQAMDLAGKDTGIDPFVAPFDVRCAQKVGTTGVLFESTQPIQLTDGTQSIIHFICWHDNNTSDIQVDAVYGQGQHIYDEGTAGYATGNHVHVEFGRGPAPTGYPLVKNRFGQWGLPNAIAPQLVLTYNSGNIVINFGGVPFIKDGGQAPAQAQTSAPQSTGERVPQSGTCKILVDTLNVRTAPSKSAEVVATYSKDETFTYDSFIDAEGIRWVSYIGASGNRRYVARRTLDNSQTFTTAY